MFTLPIDIIESWIGDGGEELVTIQGYLVRALSSGLVDRERSERVGEANTHLTQTRSTTVLFQVYPLTRLVLAIKMPAASQCVIYGTGSSGRLTRVILTPKTAIVIDSNRIKTVGGRTLTPTVDLAILENGKG